MCHTPWSSDHLHPPEVERLPEDNIVEHPPEADIVKHRRDRLWAELVRTREFKSVQNCSSPAIDVLGWLRKTNIFVFITPNQNAH